MAWTLTENFRFNLRYEYLKNVLNIKHIATWQPSNENCKIHIAPSKMWFDEIVIPIATGQYLPRGHIAPSRRD